MFRTESWVGFDFDGTLRRLSDGLPVPGMVERVRDFLDQRIPVRIVTARVARKYDPKHITDTIAYIEEWCRTYIGVVLPVTSEKDYDMIVLYDDRAIAVKTDTGELKGWMTGENVGVHE